MIRSSSNSFCHFPSFLKNVPMIKPSALLNLPTLVGLIPDPMKIGIDEEPRMINSNGTRSYLYSFEIKRTMRNIEFHEILPSALCKFSSSSWLASDPVLLPVNITPSALKNSAAFAVSQISTSLVMEWALCFFLISQRMATFSASICRLLK